jgi:cellulose 1,4-beta-cellobiosidase
VGDAGSASASATTYTVPVVTSFTATTASTSGINLSWSATDSGGPGIANYKLYRGSTLLTTTTATSYSDTGLAAGTAYSYTVYANDSAGDAGSASASATTYTAPVVTSFTATTASDSGINLSWSATDSGGPGIANYKLYRGSTLLTTTTATSYSDTGLSAGTAYSYTVYADDSVGDAGSSSTSATTYTVLVVSSFTATTASPSAINLSWSGTDSGGPGIANYKLYRGSTLLTTTTATSYSDTGLSAGTTYTYTLYAVDTAGDAGSASASAQTLPAAPTLSLSPTSTYSGYTFSVYWTTPAGTLNHFTLSRQVNSGTPALTTYPASTTSIQDSGVAPRTTTYLTYQVRACVSSDESACSVWSNSAVETVLTGCPPGGCLAPPPAPVK